MYANCIAGFIKASFTRRRRYRAGCSSNSNSTCIRNRGGLHDNNRTGGRDFIIRLTNSTILVAMATARAPPNTAPYGIQVTSQTYLLLLAIFEPQYTRLMLDHFKRYLKCHGIQMLVNLEIQTQTCKEKQQV